MIFMKIMKFGGTSVGKPERMKQVKDLITKDKEDKIVVLSALSGTTNALVGIGDAMAVGNKLHAKDIIDNLIKHYEAFINELLENEVIREKARKVIHEHFDFLNIILKISFNDALNKDILAQGELMSTKLFCFYLEEIGVDHAFLPALDFMMIDSNDEPQVLAIRERLKKSLEHHPGHSLFITQGYICRNSKGEVDNLKRGGSDYSASLIAAAAMASVCEIWTDIDGMHNNDPRVVNKTKAIEHLSFDEAAELAYFGAKILHPASIWPAQHYNIPVKLLNTMEPEAKGTIILKEADSVGVKAVAAKDGIVMIKIKSGRMLLAYGFLRKIFEVFEKYKTSIDMITTSEVAVSVTIDSTLHLEEISKELIPLGELEIKTGQTIVSVVGNKLTNDKELLSKLFSCLASIDINMVSYGGSAHNVSVLIPTESKNDTLKLLNKGIFGFA
jgi:aspartate kinase